VTGLISLCHSCVVVKQPNLGAQCHTVALEQHKQPRLNAGPYNHHPTGTLPNRSAQQQHYGR
jgi:hypothetical protein